MTREEIVNSFYYQAAKEAVAYSQKFADNDELQGEVIDAFEKGAEWVYTHQLVDWEQRRYEIAKAVLTNPAFVRIDRYDNGFEVFHVDKTVATALKAADELIKRLKGGEE